MTRTKSSRALVSVVLAVLMAVAFMPAISYTSFAATAKKATKVTKVYHKANTTYTRTVGSAWTLKYKLSPSKLTTAAKKVVWKSSNKSVVSVSAKSGNKAAVSFKKVGTATVTVYTKANKKAKATWKFKVVPKKAEAAKVAATGVTVKANNSTDYTKTLKVGTTLTATVAPANATGVTYQWYADGTAIDGATNAQFTVTSSQIGKKITVKAKANTGDEVTSAESAKVAEVTVDNFKIVNTSSTNSTANVGDKLKVAYQSYNDSGVLTDGNLDVADFATIQWYRTRTYDNGNKVTEAISGATDSTYTVTSADADNSVYAVVTPNSGVKAASKTTTGGKAYMAGVESVKSGAYTLNSVSVGTASTVISGVGISVDGSDKVITSDKEVTSGTVLTAKVTPSAASNAVNYQWYRNGYRLTGATSSTYTATEGGKYTVRITLKSDEKTYGLNATDKANGYSESAHYAYVNASFTGISVVNKTASNANRSTNISGDQLYVSVNGVNADATNGYTVTWKKVGKDQYGNRTETAIDGMTATATSSKNYSVAAISDSLDNGDVIVGVLEGHGLYANYSGKTSDITITKSTSSSAIEGLDADTTFDGSNTTVKSVKLTGVASTDGSANGASIQWQKNTSEIGLNSAWTDISGATGTSYTLDNSEAKTTFQIRAKITKADGTVEYTKAYTITYNSSTGNQTFA
jgi:hypothetical protein